MEEPDHRTAYLRAGRWSARFFSLFATFDLPPRPPEADDGSLIIAANHRSFFDVFLAYILLTGWGLSPRMFVRGNYFSLPGIGWLLRVTGCIPVHSGEGPASVDEALTELNSNRPVAIMPEGRLVRAEDRPTGVGEARDGVGTMALKSGATVAVVGVSGSERVWPLGRPVPVPRLRRTRMVVRVRILGELHGSPTEVKDHIMAQIGELVREAESVPTPY